MRASGRPGILIGAMIAAMLTAALIAITFAAWQVAGLPFAPFDVFDWVTRVLPGPVIAVGIHSMVAVIRALHLGPTSVVAKGIEQAMGVAGLFSTGVAGGAIVFGLARALRGRHVYPLSVAMGVAVGGAVVVINGRHSPTAHVTPGVGVLWTAIVFILWGAAFGWAFRRLSTWARGAASPQHQGAESQALAERLDRRRFLIRLGGATAAITVSGAMVGAISIGRRQGQQASVSDLRWSALHPLPNAGATVQPAPGTRPEYPPLDRHYRIDINTVPPQIDGSRWRLKVGGAIERPLALSLDELRVFEPLDQFITLACISNPVGGDLIGTTRWTGVSLQRLLPGFRLRAEATHLKILSHDGFYEVVPLEIIRSDERVMLAYAWDGVPLPPEHGFPLRIYVPDVYGMKQPKWIESIEATDHWEPGYWVVRGWDKVAQMKATSVIDTVAADATLTNAAGQRLVPIGGIAHAGARGISKVEVQVDDASWQQAELRTPLSDLTWVIWRYDWPFQPGEHTFTVRCSDGSGEPQIVTPASPEPSGATGLHSVERRI